jgi:hypothetical protein
MPEKRSEIVKTQGVIRTISSHQQLMKVNRRLRIVVIFLMAVVLVLGFWFIPGQYPVVSHKQLNVAEIAAEGMNPAVSAEVNNLKGQLIGLVSGSIESKLKSLEDSIRLGSVNNSLGTIADLKNDIKTLRSYSDTQKKPEVIVSNQQLAQEVTHLKHLIYTSLASCGLMFAAAAGVWVKLRKRLPYKEIKKNYLGRH